MDGLQRNVLLFFISIFLHLFNQAYAVVITDAERPEAIGNYYDKYSEIHLNYGQSKVKVLGTINTSQDGHHKLSIVANNLLESVRSQDIKQKFNNSELFLINVGDYPDVMPYTAGKSPFFKEVGESYRGGGTFGNNGVLMVFQSEEFICKMGVITRYYKGNNDTTVRRWDNPIHEIGHWVEMYGNDVGKNYSGRLKNSPDFEKLSSGWQNSGFSEVFTILVTAWFDAQYSYGDMPKNREEFRNRFPDFYKLFQEAFDESKRNIGQYCENEKELVQLDKLNNNQKRQYLTNQFGIYPQSIIAKKTNNLPNVIQQVNSVYKLGYEFVLTDQICSDSKIIANKDNTTFTDCANFCRTSECGRFSFAPDTGSCALYRYSDRFCQQSNPIDLATTKDFHYVRMQIPAILFREQTLKINQQIFSSNKKYMLTLQADGNLCLYNVQDNGSKSLWCNMKYNYGQNNNTGLVMQKDCNLVVYKDVVNKKDAVWSSNTWDKSEGCYAVLRDTGNFDIYDMFNARVWGALGS